MYNLPAFVFWCWSESAATDRFAAANTEWWTPVHAIAQTDARATNFEELSDQSLYLHEIA